MPISITIIIVSIVVVLAHCGVIVAVSFYFCSVFTSVTTSTTATTATTAGAVGVISYITTTTAIVARRVTTVILSECFHKSSSEFMLCHVVIINAIIIMIHIIIMPSH